MSEHATPTAVVDLVRAVAHEASEEEIGTILASYPALRAAADRLHSLELEEDR